jgi:hypothetical protein
LKAFLPLPPPPKREIIFFVSKNILFLDLAKGGF